MKSLIPILSIIFAGCLALHAPAATYATKDYVDRMDSANKAEIVSSTNSLYQSIAISNYYTKAETDDAIDALAAYYITSNAQGDAFPTLSALTNANTYYSGGAVRVPTRNDYAVVLADESHGSNEWRYIYTIAEGATTGQWDAQYPIETNDYEGLSNKPQINGHTLTGNMTAKDLGLSVTTMTTNDVCNIVTNEARVVSAWTIDGLQPGDTYQFWYDGPWGQGWSWGLIVTDKDGDEYYGSTGFTTEGPDDATKVVFDGGRFIATRTIETKNTLGLARIKDLPPLTNGLPTMADIPSTNGFVTAAITNGCLPKTGGTIYNPNTQSGSLRIWDGGDSEITFNVDSSATITMKTGSPNGLSAVFGGGGGGGNVTVSLLNDDENATLNVGSYRQDDMFGGTVNIGRANTPSTLTVGGTNVMDYVAQTGADAQSAISDAATASTNYTDTAIATADTTYQSFALTAPTNVNQSVQYVNIVSAEPSVLSVLLPEGNGTKDWIIYVNARTNVSISLPAATWWMADVAYTNDIAPETPTALYFSQIDTGLYLFSRQELTEVITP